MEVWVLTRAVAQDDEVGMDVWQTTVLGVYHTRAAAQQVVDATIDSAESWLDPESTGNGWSRGAGDPREAGYSIYRVVVWTVTA